MVPLLPRVTAGALVALLVWASPSTLLTASPGGLQSQPPGRPPLFRSGGSSGFPVSPSVVATYMTHAREAELDALLIMVLWRGRPGWFLGGARQDSGASSFSGGGTRIALTRIGGIELSVQLERDRQRAVIQGHVVDLQHANTFLVDGIDEPDGPVIVDDFYIEAGLPVVPSVGPDRMLPLLRASPDILAFLRCDVPFPPRLGPGVPPLCAQLASR